MASSGKSLEQGSGAFWPPVCVELTPPAQPCLGLEREASTLRKGLTRLGPSFGGGAGWLSAATMKVKVIPVLEDNYMYLVIEEHTREAVAVDVAVPKRVRAGCGPRPFRAAPRPPWWEQTLPVL